MLRSVGGACLDVYEEESDFFFSDKSDEDIKDEVLLRLLSFNNVIVTSHQAFLTETALTNIADATIDNIKVIKCLFNCLHHHNHKNAIVNIIIGIHRW